MLTRTDIEVIVSQMQKAIVAGGPAVPSIEEQQFAQLVLQAFELLGNLLGDISDIAHAARHHG